MSTNLAAPVAQTERLVILDSLRGIAILAILLMNIPGFGLPHIAVSDPGVVGETGKNYYTWYIIDGVFDSTQRGMFSILFGAGIILLFKIAFEWNGNDLHIIMRMFAKTHSGCNGIIVQNS